MIKPYSRLIAKRHDWVLSENLLVNYRQPDAALKCQEMTRFDKTIYTAEKKS